MRTITIPDPTQEGGRKYQDLTSYAVVDSGGLFGTIFSVDAAGDYIAKHL